MKLHLAVAQRLLGALKRVDEDDTTRLSEAVRLIIAININRLLPNVSAFERVCQQAQIKMTSAKLDDAAMLRLTSEMQLTINDLGKTEAEFELQTFALAELKLSENPKIRGQTVAALAPIMMDKDGKPCMPDVEVTYAPTSRPTDGAE